MAGEAVHLKRTRHKPALTVTGRLGHRLRTGGKSAAGKRPTEVLHPFPSRKSSTVRKRHNTARAAICGAEEPRLTVHLVYDIVRAAGTEVRSSMHLIDIMALRTGFLLRHRRRHAGSHRNLVAITVDRNETMHGNRTAPVEFSGKCCKRNNNRSQKS